MPIFQKCQVKASIQKAIVPVSIWILVVSFVNQIFYRNMCAIYHMLQLICNSSYQFSFFKYPFLSSASSILRYLRASFILCNTDLDTDVCWVYLLRISSIEFGINIWNYFSLRRTRSLLYYASCINCIIELW